LNVTDQRPVPVPDITNATLKTSFAYDSPMEANAPNDASDLKYVGPRTEVLTIGAATASSGRIQDIIPPIHNSSYQGYDISFAAPYVRCQDANETQKRIIDAVVNQTITVMHGTYIEAYNVFSAFIPIFGSPVNDATTNTSTVYVDGQQITALWEADLQRPLNTSTNEIWMRFYRYKKDSSGKYITGPDNLRIPPDPHFLTCTLYNTTYHVAFSWNNGVQSVVNRSIDITGKVKYPNDIRDHPSDIVTHSYTSIFQVLANQILGSMVFFNDTALKSTTDYINEPPHFSSFQTRLPETSLVGSDDLDYYFSINKQLFTDNPPEPFSLQRLQDKAVAKNQTLDYLIEELAYNITISLLHDPLLSRFENVTAMHSDDRIQYDYVWRNLIIAYSLAVAAVAIANLVGGWAYRQNQAAFDRSLSTIVSVTRGRELDKLFPECCHGVQPLPNESLVAALEVHETRNGKRSGRNIVLVEDVKPLCMACNPPPPPSPQPGPSGTGIGED
jgi:hypothetical protein